ncbi:hypothetical protein TREMEDRAFT_67697 [Tremella mesenterica DSM 1558]|uniref:uncharacterized protein n=1 Tax=Tremella mesenterica (strain ATCC 24925 / CBS 8224 / DSM 1558 / NBRC 9311 / NRRL Y-6157 / RJB 2259-6 / UBC 559-6) TaxID=578456 RepID=UPI0003F48E9C|nr:uncharacterized protein TREMEDRAFT_67697 [Tremella mesenterica DSM 1558]EIW71321.1 hypothetical protein TREMEDRAFT_67697 [Tremella mesenterica DSM 1558]
MNHGYDDDEGMNWGRYMAPPPDAFDEYYRAYSVAVMSQRDRIELLYGGKIIMPASALAKLSSLDIPGPWTFQLRNPRHMPGVLEFIADEGNVHLPAWMMKTLQLEEGDPIRLTGASLPKGKLVKLQAQSTDFLQVSDPRAVLESALRFYSTLTKGDIIEITYNSLIFEFAVLETQPEGSGISVIDTDLEVDFATPLGYVEPPRAAPVPIPTMAEKLKIDLNHTTSASSSRPASSLGGTAGSGDSTPRESFTGVGQSLSGKRIKGKGLTKKIEEAESSSKLSRNGGAKIITPDSLNDTDRKVPAALLLPAGKFFFGYKYVPFDASKAPKPKVPEPEPAQAFSGAGQSLRNKGKHGPSVGESSNSAPKDEKPDPWANLGSGNQLRSVKTTNQVPSSVTPNKTQTTRSQVDPIVVDDDDDFMYDGQDWDEHEVIDVDSD